MDKGEIRISYLLKIIIMLYAPTLAFNFNRKSLIPKRLLLVTGMGEQKDMPYSLDVSYPCTSFSIPSYKTLYLLRSSVSSSLVTCELPELGGHAGNNGHS